MTTPFDDTNFTPSMNLFCWYTGVLIYFYRYKRAFCLDLFGSVMFPNKSADSVSAMYLTFLDDYDRGRAVLFCLYFNLSRSCLEPGDCIARPLLLLQMWLWIRFPIGETEVNQCYSSQLIKLYFVHILLEV
jgi:Plant mobile domain